MFMKGCIWTASATIAKIIKGSGSPFIWTTFQACISNIPSHHAGGDYHSVCLPPFTDTQKDESTSCSDPFS
ncbi:hypothetical protein DPMN_097794 [Dreissena polymorpha]|uniref:Uncharacterized protein n=1 Tax=Dreissena polymorpha TaxID=45954 RepID=A0A9D4LAY0_DREPO|nr:hypothetical protein DPMN_097794 [Dreissena polymorpha]